MESWRFVWRFGIAPILSTESLEALERGLEGDDPRLIQGHIYAPLTAHGPCRVTAGCALGYCGLADGLETAAEVEEFFARMWNESDRRLGEVGGSMYFLGWFDETPRGEVRRLLLPEVRREVARRRVCA